MTIPYESEMHDRLITEIRARVERWRNKIRERIREWSKVEDLYFAYTPLPEDELRRKALAEEGKPQYTTIVIPYTYATVLSALTYWSSVFLSRAPIFQYMGRHGEAEQQVQAVEALIDYQVHAGGMLPALYGWIGDPLKYGYGVIGVYWADDFQFLTRRTVQPKTVDGVPIPDTFEEVELIEAVPTYSGNRLFNVRPHDFIFDTRVALRDFQSGEFAGRIVQISWNEVLRRKHRGDYFNTEHIEKAARDYFLDRLTGSPRVQLPGSHTDVVFTESSRPEFVEAIELIWEIVPSEFGLGSLDYPEKWVFTVAFDNVIIGAQPLGERHGRFPYFLSFYDIDPYSISPKGMIEIIRPLNEVLSWLFNSHMYNVRRALNDQFIVDPSRVTLRDIREGGPGRIIRLMPEAYGTDVRSAIQQIPVVDITRQHLLAFDKVIELIQRTTGVTDNIMGLLHPGGRKTATEVRASSSFGVNRLKTIAEYNSAVGWGPLAVTLVQASQQHYSSRQKFQIVGDLADEARRFVEVGPDDIQGTFDFIPVDGTLPIDRFAQANLWKEILIGLSQQSPIAGQYDLGRIFAWMAQLAGLKNIHQFRVKAQVAPDAQVMEMLASGRLNRVPQTPELQGVIPSPFEFGP